LGESYDTVLGLLYQCDREDCRSYKNNYLALRVLDLSYLPRPSSTAPTQNSTSTPASKRSYRWGGRIDSSSPSKKMRTSGFGTESVDGSPENPTITAQAAPRTSRAVDNDEADQHLADEIIDRLNDTSSAHHTSPSSTSVDPDVSSLSSIPSHISGSGDRPRRTPHPRIDGS